MNPLTYIIINFAIVALIWQGGLRVNVGAITQGEVVALVNYMSQILVELVKLANLIVTVNKSVACGNRIAQVLEMESSMEDGTLEIGENFSEQEMQGKSRWFPLKMWRCATRVLKRMPLHTFPLRQGLVRRLELSAEPVRENPRWSI